MSVDVFDRPEGSIPPVRPAVDPQPRLRHTSAHPNNEAWSRMPFAAAWNVYIVRCNDGSLYCGIATDVARRLHEHNSGAQGAKYTRTRRPVELVYVEPAVSRGEALKREYAIKCLSVAAKHALITSQTADPGEPATTPVS